MRIWTIPTARAERFVANDYVSACYSILCVTPRDNEKFKLFVADNGDGVYNAEEDTVLLDPTVYKQKYAAGCGGAHVVSIVGDMPANNAFAVNVYQGEECVEPMFYWYGDVIGSVVAEDEQLLANLHITDLTRSDSIVSAGNKS